MSPKDTFPGRMPDLSHLLENNRAWAAEIAKLNGVLRRNGGLPVEAERHFAEAARLAEAQHDSLLLAETLRERAELYRGQGRNREALQNLNRAHRLFEHMRAKRELANVESPAQQRGHEGAERLGGCSALHSSRGRSPS